ncbi:MAG: hypothetical protein JW751_27930 [Polyangiaceae bacterium]|nr:hypothetical protein [Polyangiaceae bacterium]
MVAPGSRSLADFFLREVIADEKGHAFAWGWSACRPGIFLGRLGEDQVSLEVVTGTDACTERSKSSGLPAMAARAFPATAVSPHLGDHGRGHVQRDFVL